MNLQTGAFGDPHNTETLILFWTKMELLHYPGAAETKQYLEQKLQREQQIQMQMQKQQLAAANEATRFRQAAGNVPELDTGNGSAR